MKQRKAFAHFKGKDALEHLVDARIKGYQASQENHGTELPGHYHAALDAAKDTAFLLLLLFAFLKEATFPIAFAFFIGLLFWKAGRSAALGYNRLERLHRLIEEERFEIEHHRDQEKEELKELYASKGFSGKLLQEVVEHLMADDNRLLQVMLEEELGLTLESYEHPLKQAAGAALGVAFSALIMTVAFFLLPLWAPPFAALVLIAISSALDAHLIKNKSLSPMIWNLSMAIVGALIAYCTLESLL